MSDLHLHDVVLLEHAFGPWPSGTTGTIVDEFPDGYVVELAGPAGETLDLLDLPCAAVRAAEPLTRSAAHA